MGKQVKVKFNGLTDPDFAGMYRDTTVGRVYDGYFPAPDETDAYGDPVDVDDELWYTDDAGDSVVSRMSHGFELVEE